MKRRLPESPERRTNFAQPGPGPNRILNLQLVVSGLAALSLALGGIGCAGPDKLSRQSQQALQQGRADDAYEKSREALDKDPNYEPARAAMIAAATQLRSEHAETMDSLAAVGDSARAADSALRWEVLARQLVPFRATLPVDSAFTLRERRVRTAAARDYYQRGDFSLRDGRPRDAYALFQRSERYWPEYRDVSGRVHQSFEAAQVTVAVLPFANQTDAPGLSRALGEPFFAQLDDHVRARNLQFTQLLAQDEVASTVTLSELDQMSRDEAIRIGRRLHVDQVLWGRYHSLRSRDEIRDSRFPMYRKELQRHEHGASTERFIETTMDVLERDRHVSVRYDMEVVDTNSRQVLAHRTDLVEASASVVFSRYDPVGDCDNYCFVPPEFSDAPESPAKKAERQWKARMGGWDLPDFLKRAHGDQRRARYDRTYLPEFGSSWDGRPVFLGELPPADDLAALALEDAWKPAVKMLEELDRK